MMLGKRVFAVLLASVINWHSANGQSAYVDLQTGGSIAHGLRTKPLMMSRFPTTFSVALSTRRNHLRTIDIDGQVWQWRLRAPSEPEMIVSTNIQPTCAVLSSDAKLLAYADSNTRLTLMDLDTKQVKFRDETQSANTVALRFSDDASLLAAISSDGNVRVWNSASTNETHDFQTEAGAVQTLAFAPEGKTLAVASFSRELRLFDVSQQPKSSTSQVIAIEDSRITAVGFTPNSKQIVIAASNGTAFVQDIDSEENRIRLDSYPFAIWSLAFDEDGQRMVAGSWDGTTRIWDTSSWRMIQKLKGHEESVSAMILDKQGMISAGLDGRLLFWPPQIPGIKPKGMITGPADPVWVAVYSPDGKRLFLGGRGERFEMWDVEKHQQLFSIKGHTTTRCAAFSPDGKMLATGGDDRTIMLSSAKEGQIDHTLKGHRGSVSAVLFVDDGKTLISGCDRGQLKFWDTATGIETASRRRHRQQLYCANVSPDQRWLITGGGHWAKGDPGELIVWDLAKRQFKATLPGHTLTVWSIMFTPDGTYFATSDSAGDVKIWNSETLKEVRTLKHETWVRPMAISPDGKTLAVGRGDGPVRLWDTTTWVEKGTCNGHDSFTFWLQYSPDGKTLATSGSDGTVRFWETQSENVQ